MAAARKKDDDDSGGAIHKMDTLPPPEGEDDAYSAATKVGPMARAAVEAMMAKAQVDENSSMPPPASFTRGVTLPKPARLPKLDPPPGELEIDKVYDEIEDGDLFEPTALLATLPPAPSAVQQASEQQTTVTPLPAPAPAPVAPAPPAVRNGPRSTLLIEIAIFAGTFAVLSAVAALAYVYWLR